LLETLHFILHFCGTTAALFAAYFWYESARNRPGELDFLDKWPDGKSHQAWIESVSRNKRGAFASFFSALFFGLQGALNYLPGG
jgi:hypothetical protein